MLLLLFYYKMFEVWHVPSKCGLMLLFCTLLMCTFSYFLLKQKKTKMEFGLSGINSAADAWEGGYVKRWKGGVIGGNDCVRSDLTSQRHTSRSLNSYFSPWT